MPFRLLPVALKVTGMSESNQNLDLVIILGSVREGRFGPVVAKWFVEQARQHGRFHVDLIDLAETSLPLALSHTPPPELADVTEKLDAADAYVVVTPEYNHSFPASVKSLIDWHFNQWQAKPVGFVSYGGMSGGIRAVEHLRQVFAEMHAMTVRDSISFVNYPELFDPDGQLKDPEGPNGAAKVLLDQLAWWAAALDQARRAHPYAPAG